MLENRNQRISHFRTYSRENPVGSVLRTWLPFTLLSLIIAQLEIFFEIILLFNKHKILLLLLIITKLMRDESCTVAHQLTSTFN